MSRKQKGKSDPVIPIRMPEDIQQGIKRVAKLSRLSDQDVMRLALVRGLPVLEKLFASGDSQAA